MAHFAKLDKTNTVISVEVINNEVITDKDGVEQEQLGINFLISLYGEGWYKQTSYNKVFRKNFAGPGYRYDSIRDAFIEPKPYPSWVLNETTCIFEAPTAHPNDGKIYDWNETTKAWDEVT